MLPALERVREDYIAETQKTAAQLEKKNAMKRHKV